MDIEGCKLPTLVYLAREKNQQHHHNFKAGALNALIRVSSEISNGQIILTVDCDMYSNDSESIRDALCFFMDEEKGHEIAYVQYPQMFRNISTHDIYSNSLCVIYNVRYRVYSFLHNQCFPNYGFSQHFMIGDKGGAARYGW